jgi:glutaredoxin 3
MPTIEIYTSPFCGFCHAAKRLLQDKGLSFVEYDVMREPAKRGEMLQRANGRHTVPQIFVGPHHIGGYDDMAALERNGKLDPIIAGG